MRRESHEILSSFRIVKNRRTQRTPDEVYRPSQGRQHKVEALEAEIVALNVAHVMHTNEVRRSEPSNTFQTSLGTFSLCVDFHQRKVLKTLHSLARDAAIIWHFR